MEGTAAEKSVPQEYVDFLICDRFGWTIEYVRSLPLEDYDLWWALMNAEVEAGQVQEKRRKQNRR